MAFADTTKPRGVQGIGAPVKLVIKSGVAVKAGDLLGYSSGWCLADGNAAIRAQYVCGDTLTGDGYKEATGYKQAVVWFDGGTAGTEGGDLYLSDTAGGYSTSAGTEPQRVGVLSKTLHGTVNLTDAGFAISQNLTIASNETADIIFVATRRVRVTKISERHATAAGGAATGTVERLQGTEAPGAGDDLLGTTKIDLNGTANTTQSPALSSTAANLILEAGNALAFKKATGTNMGALANACVTVELEPA